ncbi:glycosyltransferase family 4 protein [Flavobacterium sp.]|uniref:glycosyltransferase family 4 protein n=1 Tax=Flavobacterium sp. TaxID=239 RepID=UPI00261CA4A5|nr:glycosyltransferase family 4 protein [Flavobacterium sp.]MDD3003994.1 glycosyltransferase family 4 protein [Flavobacterium sp.]
MKIGLVLPSVPAYSETFFNNKIKGLQQHGHEVLLFVNQKTSPNYYSNCKIIQAPQLGGSKLGVVRVSFFQVLRAVFINPKKSYKLYHLNQQDGLSLKANCKQIIANQFLLRKSIDWLHFGYGTMALGRENVAEVIKAQMAVSFRGFDHYVYPNKNPDCYKILFSKKVHYHVLSEGMKKRLIQHNISPMCIHKITPAIDINQFKYLKINKKDVLQFTTTARLHWIKGLEYTLEALALLKQNKVEFYYNIIGEGVEFERLKFACHQLNLTKEVRFVGKLSPEKVREVLTQTDVYIQYSLQEGFCNAVLEAQAMGLLCVVSDAEGLSENVIDNHTGWVVPKRNAQLLAQKIKEVITLSEEEQQKIRENARERIQKEFNLPKQQQEFINFYKS